MGRINTLNKCMKLLEGMQDMLEMARCDNRITWPEDTEKFSDEEVNITYDWLVNYYNNIYTPTVQLWRMQSPERWKRSRIWEANLPEVKRLDRLLKKMYTTAVKASRPKFLKGGRR